MTATTEDLKYLRERQAALLAKKTQHDMTREQVAADVEKFLAKGGKIKQLATDFVPSLRGKRW
jgi:hypothetical protein